MRALTRLNWDTVERVGVNLDSLGRKFPVDLKADIRGNSAGKWLEDAVYIS